MFTEIHTATNVLQRAIDYIVSWINSHGFTLYKNGIYYLRKEMNYSKYAAAFEKPAYTFCEPKILVMHFDQHMTWEHHIN